MPELPEVETIRRDLAEILPGLEVISIHIRHPKTVQTNHSEFKETLLGNHFTELKRIGKLLLFELNNFESHLALHLKMTGQLIYERSERAAPKRAVSRPRPVIAGGHSDVAIPTDLPNSHTRLTLHFEDDSKLHFNDQRLFGYAKLVPNENLMEIYSGYGIEPLTINFTWRNFQAALKNRKTNIKALLLNQKAISGLGNIYVDEACFEAKIKPTRKIQSLKIAEKKALHQAIKKVIKKAVTERGTTFNHFQDAYGRTGNFERHLKVFGREGEPCKRCKTGIIQKIKHTGRGTHFCGSCQK